MIEHSITSFSWISFQAALFSFFFQAARIGVAIHSSVSENLT